MAVLKNANSDLRDGLEIRKHSMVMGDPVFVNTIYLLQAFNIYRHALNGKRCVVMIGELPHRHKIVIPGNHEFLLEDEDERGVITNAALLVNSGMEIEGLRIWGSPTTPLYGGAFGISNVKDRKRHWARMPKSLDILITHGPPFGILDVAPGSQAHEGDPELAEAVEMIEPRLHVFGHIHGARGMLRKDRTTFVNAELYGEAGDMDKSPLVVELDPIRRT